ncbi:MAG TPA: IclR family transcriptional regulator [Candidatus Lustribacter sp.]|nr:IclR family transcriptional regulator [Candidatus Lustribacter sp.]
MSANGTQAVDRAAHLLSLVVQAQDALTFSDLCDRAGYPRSTTSRLLAALERRRLTERSADGHWVPGPLFAQYAARHTVDTELARVASPFLERLGEATGETVNLAVVRGGSVVQIAQVESRFMRGSRDWVGVDVPAHCSALGKVLCAYGAVQVPATALDTPTEHSLTTAAAVRAQFPQICHRGYAVTQDELEIGLTGVAAPVAVGGAIVAALGVSGPSSRLAADLPGTGHTVVAHALALSTQLGRTRKEGAA